MSKKTSTADLGLNQRSNSLSNVIAYALIGAIAFVVMKFEFPILPGVGFLKFDFSDVIVTIGTFLFGPLAGVIIALIRTICSLIFSGFALPSLVGEFAAFIATLSFALPFYYFAKNVDKDNSKKRKFHVKPLIGLIVGILSMTLVLSLANAFIITPVYAVTSMANIPSISSYQALYNFTVNVYLKTLLHIPSMSAYIFGLIVPFNLIKGVINALVVYFLFEATLKNLKPFVQRKFNIK